MLRILLTSIFLLTFAGSYAQTYSVKGSVKDTAGVPLTGTLIKLKWGSDSTATSVNIAGEFSLPNVKSA